MAQTRQDTITQSNVIVLFRYNPLLLTGPKWAHVSTALVPSLLKTVASVAKSCKKKHGPGPGPLRVAVCGGHRVDAARTMSQYGGP